MRTKREMVLRALERGIEVSLRENRYVLSDNGTLSMVVKTSPDCITWTEHLATSDISFNYFTEMCNELPDEYIFRINMSSAMVDLKYGDDWDR